VQQYAINLNQPVNTLHWRNNLKQFVNRFQLSDDNFGPKTAVVEHKENVERRSLRLSAPPCR
jgi:hypothetical protein